MKTPVLDTLFNKLRGLSHATLLKEKTSIQVFSDEFCEIFQTSFLRNTSRPLLQTTHALKTFKHYLPHVFYFLTLFSTLFPALYDILIYFSDIYQYLWYISLLSMISLNLGSKCLILVFQAAILKNYFHVWNQPLQFVLLQSLVKI